MSMRYNYYKECIIYASVDWSTQDFLFLPQNDIIDCEISSMYPVGFTNCHFHQFRDNIALVDCGNDLTSITITNYCVCTRYCFICAMG